MQVMPLVWALSAAYDGQFFVHSRTECGEMKKSVSVRPLIMAELSTKFQDVDKLLEDTLDLPCWNYGEISFSDQVNTLSCSTTNSIWQICQPAPVVTFLIDQNKQKTGSHDSCSPVY